MQPETFSVSKDGLDGRMWAGAASSNVASTGQTRSYSRVIRKSEGGLVMCVSHARVMLPDSVLYFPLLSLTAYSISPLLFQEMCNFSHLSHKLQ